jgi:DNA-binding response OmpR family regulator
MSDTTRSLDRLPVAISWVESRGIETRPWPSPDGHPHTDHPVLYLVEPGAEAPRCGPLEDWVREPVDTDELFARADRLLVRARELGASLTRVDGDGTLRVGDQIIILSDQEARLMRALLDQVGQLVLREDLTAAVWPDDPPADPRALDNRLKTLRQRLRGVPLKIHTVRGWGLLLEQVAT